MYQIGFHLDFLGENQLKPPGLCREIRVMIISLVLDSFFVITSRKGSFASLAELCRTAMHKNLEGHGHFLVFITLMMVLLCSIHFRQNDFLQISII